MKELREYSVTELLQSHSKILEELRRRDIVRSSNSPSGDYAELLFATAFGWQLSNNSSAGFDAITSSGLRVQIKCRRISKRNPSRQLSALRNLNSQPFDLLAAVLLDENYNVVRAALIPLAVVLQKSTFTKHVNAHRFILRDAVWQMPDVQDVTNEVKRTQELL